MPGHDTLFIGGEWVPPARRAFDGELGPGAIAAYQNLKTVSA
jgi:hypothetical protein